ncbi:MAG: hypothetical protein AAFV25_02440 [Bacteroidota bacterium]
MKSLEEQFSFQIRRDFFEADTHIGLQGLEIAGFRMLHGESPHEDILVVLYKGSPYLSFYRVDGRQVDVDHYLPESYLREDTSGADMVIANLRDIDVEKDKSKNAFAERLHGLFGGRTSGLGTRLVKKLGLETNEGVMRKFLALHEIDLSEDVVQQMTKRFPHFYGFLETYILFQQQLTHGYVHITAKDNIIITPLNKRSGIAVMIETQSADGFLLPPRKWLITRTEDARSLEQNLVFRSPDIQRFFQADGNNEWVDTERYKIYHTPDQIAIDSLVDNTDNLLRLSLVNDCFQLLPSDENVIVLLSQSKELTVVNAHLSVVPHKWPKKYGLPNEVQWLRADDNLYTLFVQYTDGEVALLDLTVEEPVEIERFGKYAFGFELDQNGSLLLREIDTDRLIKIETNVRDLETPAERKNLTGALKSIAHLFKGDSLFVKTQFAKVVTTEKAPEEKKLPTAFELAKYDFETNVDHLLVEAGTDYDALLGVQQKIAIARSNIAEELAAQAEKEGVALLGQRLQSAIDTILKPSEKRIRNLVEEARASDILSQVQSFQQKIDELSDPSSYRDILNSVRKFEDELRAMRQENIEGMLTDFKGIQKELSTAFSNQIASDDSSLRGFINGEIEQIESAIRNTHDPRQLEMLMSTHPAALELMSLLKQPFILESIAKEQKLSPAGIQSRLYRAVSQRKDELRVELERKEAEKQAAKMQLANMIRESIDFFVSEHSGGFSDLELSANSSYQQLISDISKLEKEFRDVRLALDMRRRLERRILERNRADLEKMVAFEGKYAFIQNDPDLYVDLESAVQNFPTWSLQLIEKKGFAGTYLVSFIRSTDYTVHRPSTTENLQSGKAFELSEEEYPIFSGEYEDYCDQSYSAELLDIVWKVTTKEAKAQNFPQYKEGLIKQLQSKSAVQQKALRCALEKKRLEYQERHRERYVPVIPPEFIDDTPYFQDKLHEFVIKAKLQRISGTGVILLSGPPSTGKSVFLKFISSLMNREYFEHAADKWQTKNSLITAIKFGEYGPFSTPAGFARAITTPYGLINIEEIKEWPEALRKSLNPFFAGSDVFIAPDGTSYQIGENILLCAAANLGSMYRQDDEPFTADFWSRIEVVEYDYAPEKVSRSYFQTLHQARAKQFLTMQDLVRHRFGFDNAPEPPKEKAIYFSRQFLEFTLLPKADEKVKRQNLLNYIREFFKTPEAYEPALDFNPEESAKVALRRLKEFQGYSVQEFFDLFDHFVNGQNLRHKRLGRLQTSDIERYEQLRCLCLCLRYMEGCLRRLREKFYSSAGQTEIEGTNREFIKAVYLLDLLGRL